MDPDDELPIPQPEARRRLHAALALAGMRVTDLAPNSGFRASMWEKLAGGSRTFKLRHAHAVARKCPVPDEWFTVPALGEAVRAGAAALGAASEVHEKPRHPQPPK